jgi:hypothetical protein
MRECIRCKTEMIENLIVRDSNDASRLVLTNDKFFAKVFGKVKAAACPNCGEISIYIEDTDKLNDYIRQN